MQLNAVCMGGVGSTVGDHLDLPRCCCLKPGQAAQQSGFSDAVAPLYKKYLAGLNIKAQIGQDRQPSAHDSQT